MKFHPQIIYKGKNAEYAILPIKEYKALMEAYEDLKDIHTIETIKAENNECFSMSLVQAIANGKNRILAFREYRNLSQAELAALAGVSEERLVRLESGKVRPTAAELKILAKELSLDVDDFR